jgi:hypothetical protein
MIICVHININGHCILEETNIYIYVHIYMHIYTPTNFFFFDTGYHYVAQAAFELVILLPQSPKCWDYRPELLHPI